MQLNVFDCNLLIALLRTADIIKQHMQQAYTLVQILHAHQQKRM